MKYVKNTLDFRISEACAVALGKFDGLHSGHQYLMDAMTLGKEEGLKTVIFTFDIPPKSLNESSYNVLSTNEEKSHIFARAGVDYVIECPFTEQFRQMTPYEFLAMLTSKINVKRMVAGTDFGFGYKRSGTYKDLQKYAEHFGYEAVIVDKKQYKGQDISSTRIRECIAAGEMEEANILLGHPYFVSGPVMRGNQIGRTIGIPTANQVPPAEKLLPPNGVYAVRVTLNQEEFIGISNVGCKPTIEGENPIGVETFIFDFDRHIYGEEITVHFLKYIRKEQKFASLEELKNQMNRDITVCKKYFQECCEKNSLQ